MATSPALPTCHSLTATPVQTAALVIGVMFLLIGIAGIAAARIPSAAGIYLLLGGLVYLALWVFGLLVDKDGAVNFIPLDSVDDWLHVTLGVGMIGLGILLTRGRRVDKNSGS